MSYFKLKFKVDFLGHLKNVIINISFFLHILFRFSSRILQLYSCNRAEKEKSFTKG